MVFSKTFESHDWRWYAMGQGVEVYVNVQSERVEADVDEILVGGQTAENRRSEHISCND